MLTRLLLDGATYLRSNPGFLVAAARNAARMSVSLPIDLLQWAIERRPRGKGPERIDLTAAPPGFAVAVTVDLYGTKIDVGAKLRIESIDVSSESLRVGLRVRDLDVKAPPGSPAAMMIGSLDLRNPGALLKMMPAKHNALVEADGDRFVVDLLQIKPLRDNATLRRVLGAVGDVLSVRDLRTEDDVVVLQLRANLFALPGALAHLTGH